jgi:hypothetical protein
MKLKAVCCVLFAFALLNSVSAENARLPYAQLYQMQRAQAEMSGAYTNLVVVLCMESASTNVKPSELDVYIDAKSGKVPVKIGPDGDFSVPMREDWLAENPWIITNQPRGTMKLDWFVGLVVRRVATSIRYKPLMQVVRDCGDVRERMRQVFPSVPKAVVAGLKLTFAPPERGGSIVIHSERADKKLEADSKGELTILLDPDLLEENPLVTLSKEPAGVELVSQQ